MSRYTDLKDRRILLVEDVELNQFLARHIMESWGCFVDVVENGSKAVQKIEAQDYDLVLMDIQMPVMDGIEATKLIRSIGNEKKSSIPIVALTANTQKSECEIYLQVGMNDYLAKPFEEPSLFKTIVKNIKQGGESTNGQNGPVAAPDKPSRVKLYDLAMVEAISGGDKSFIKRMLALFLETVPATLQDIRNAADRAEWLQLSKHAHKLKSTIDSMGIASLKSDIRTIEAGGKTGNDPALLLSLSQKVISEMKLVMDQVKEEMDK